MSSSPPGLSPEVADWLHRHHQGVLVTIRADGSPQTSNIVFAFDGTAARVSVTDDRAKTRNLRRDPRAVLHVLGDHFGQYAALRVRGTVGSLTTEPGDQVGRELLDVYVQIAGKPHPDPNEFFAAMVSQRRLLLMLTVTAARASGLPA